MPTHRVWTEDGDTPTVPTEEDSKSLSTQFFGQIGLPAFIITTFFPQIVHQLSKYPKLVKLLSIPLALWIGSEFVWNQVYSLWSKLMSTAMTSVKIDASDSRLHSSFRRFLYNKHVMQSHREMSASSKHFLRHQVDGGRDAVRVLALDTDVVYDSLNKTQFFWHEGRLFLLTVERGFKQIQLADLTIWTFGWSPEPIRKILDRAFADCNNQLGKVMTSVMVPANGASYWTARANKPRRPLESVYLADGEKQKLVQDMGEYLDEATVRWYGDRGIPHRRGYLFHGKPGTGKTTLALALAGHFKLNVYILSLLDNDINDNTLLSLFASIGRGCLVLLEDVDVAGLDKRPKRESKTKKKAKAKAKGKNKDKDGEKETAGVTLSGLLNAIDGAAAPEGHILIMTSNDPEALDEALVRAGRVDVKVEFKNASRTQIRDIFINMYHPIGADEASTFYIADGESAAESSAKGQKVETRVVDEEILCLAEQFANVVPEYRFSPAQLQDYLILYKNKPQAAICGAEAWLAKSSGEQHDPGQDDTPDDSASEDENDEVFTGNPSEQSSASSSIGDLPVESSDKA
jgi:hypothetical protein